MFKRAGCRSRRRGSVLILVVALLAVLFVTGLAFMSGTAKDRQSAVISRSASAIVLEADAVVDLIKRELVEDVFDKNGVMLSGNGSTEDFDFPCEEDPWLAPILPETTTNGYLWRQISRIDGGGGPGDRNVLASALDADADRDGVNDSRWVYGASNRFRYAVRVIDLCGMINPNTAGRGFPDDLGTTPYHVAAAPSNVQEGWGTYYKKDGDGRMLIIGSGHTQEVGQFYGRGASALGEGRLDDIPDADYALELDNSFLRTSNRYPNAVPFRVSETLARTSYGSKPGPVWPRLAVCWANTFATSRNQIPDIRQNPANPTANNWSYNMYYADCGWTRELRSNVTPPGQPPQAEGVTTWADWTAILNKYESSGIAKAALNGTLAHGAANPHDKIYTQGLVAAIVLSGVCDPTGSAGLTPRQIEQLVVNLVDWRDSDNDVSTAGEGGGAGKVDTVFNSPGVFGNEPQVFITEVGAYLDATTPANNRFAVELFCPYNTPVDLSGWQIRTSGGTVTIPNGTIVPAPADNARQPFFVVRSHDKRSTGANWAPVLANVGSFNDPTLHFGVGVNLQDILLLRPAADGTMVLVDRASKDNLNSAPGNTGGYFLPAAGSGSSGTRHARRGDRQWMQSRDLWKIQAVLKWGQPNGIITADGADPENPTKDGFYNNNPIGGDYRSNGLVAPIAIYNAPNWQSGVVYYKGDVRREPADSSLWICVAAHVGTSFAADRGAGRWRSYVAEFETLGLLHQLMLVGPEADGAAGAKSVVDRITEAKSAAAVRELYLDFSNTARGDCRILKNLVRLDRRYVRKDGNQYDWNGNGQSGPDDLSELRIAGKININTATPHVMRYINYYMCPTEGTHDGGWRTIGSGTGWNNMTAPWSQVWDPLTAPKIPNSYFDFNQAIYEYREKLDSISGSGRPSQTGRLGQTGFRDGIGEVMKVYKMADLANIFSQCVFPRTVSGISGSIGSFRYTARNLRPEHMQRSPLTVTPAELCSRPWGYFNTAVPRLNTSGVPCYDAAVSKTYFWNPDQATSNDHNERHFLFDRISDLITTRSDTFLAYVLVQEMDGSNVVRQRRLVVVLDRSMCNYPPGHDKYVPPQVVGHNVATW